MKTDFLSLTGFQWQCITMVLISLVIRFIIGRRRFNRRGLGGLQQYSSYSKGLVVGFIERFLMMLTGVLIVVCTVLFLTGYP
ncbi:hypothetical protein [Dyadobacter frigoris]|uniref:Molybdenum ABC transporter permease n=1 Tax=Dyadobacter frigoris TaxID=2576211 RepID=A0A4U6CR97_9BACT|nr:hypothetical protein [Dyadobacter frigoris]TKT85987.1 hypothetical protein FDK13_32835 [Dyadobacter frigoris]